MSEKRSARAKQSFKPSPHTSQVHQTIFDQPDFTDTEPHLINRLLEKNPYKTLQHQENGTLQGFKKKIHARAYASAYYTKTRSDESIRKIRSLERRLSCSAHANILPALIPSPGMQECRHDRC